MNRSEFILATAIILFVAFAFGWFAHWILHRFRRVGEGTDIPEMDRLAQALHDAEEARDEAFAHMQARETELSNRITQTEAELRAAMEGLRNARAEAEELRAHIERIQSH